jgi:type VI secretion system protein ImpJ
MWPPSLKLMPQHLELHDEYVERLMEARAKIGGRATYGWLSMSVDDAALAEGRLVLSNVAAVFPSGTLVRHEGALEADVGASLADASSSASVWLVLSKLAPDAPGIATDNIESVARYRRVTEGAEAALVPFVRLVHAPPGDDEEALLVGQFERRTNGIDFSSSAMPALLAVSAFAPLVALLDKTIEGFERRIAELLASRDRTPLDVARFAPAQGPALQLLVTLQQHLPVLVDLRARRVAHPEELFEVLASVTGALSSVTDVRPEPVPAYEHENMGAVFADLVERTLLLTARTARERLMTFPLKRLDDTTYRAQLRAEAFVGRRHYLVATGADEQVLRERVPSLAKIATGAALNSLLQSSVRGVAIAVEFDPPAELPSRRSFVCYRLDVRDRYWADIRERLDLVVHLPIAAPTLELTLYAIE